MKHILRLVILSLLCFSFSGCAITHKFGPYRGKVIDADTQEPIEGAVIHLDFFINHITPLGGISEYYGSKEVLTDKKGKFNISIRNWTVKPFYTWNPIDPLICIFKPGYATYPGNPLAYIYPKPTEKPFSTTQFHTILLPKLNTKKDRKENLDSTTVTPEALFSESFIFKNLVTGERKAIGLTN